MLWESEEVTEMMCAGTRADPDRDREGDAAYALAPFHVSRKLWGRRYA